MTIAQRARAYDMIQAKGQTVTLTRRAAGAYNTATGSASIIETVQTGKAVILPFSQGLRKMAGTNIPEGAKQCLLAGLNSAGAALTAPKLDDMLTDAGGVAYVIVDIAPLAPAGLSIIYDMTVKASS